MKLNLGEIDGIPRIIDAGQCNDCYSLVKIAMLLMEAFAAKSINDLPISFDIAWYDQKAVAVLLSLLHLGVAGIRLGPTLPGFLVTEGSHDARREICDSTDRHERSGRNSDDGWKMSSFD